MSATSAYEMSPLRDLEALKATTNSRVPSEIMTALESLDSWVESQRFRGWDPHDALNSPLLRALTLKNRFAAIFWMQLLKRCPLNLRHILGISQGYNPKGMGLFLASYARKYAVTRDAQQRDFLIFFIRWLLENAASGFSGMSWGYNFPWPNRSFFAPEGTPTIVNTAFIGLGFMDLHLLMLQDLDWGSVVGHLRAGTGAKEYSKVASPLAVSRSACDFILRDLNVLSQTEGELCFSYTPLDRRAVHNANMLGAWLLASVFGETDEQRLRTSALASARFTARRQLSDGSWPYGEASNDRWVDNFHTGFVLMALKRVGECTRTDEFRESVLRGYEFWKDRMFLADGCPKYYPDRIFPIDVHSVAQAILTFLEFRHEDSEAMDRAIQVAQWSLANLQDSEGYFYYQIRRAYSIRIPYMRWAQAWMQRALTELAYSHL